MRRILLFVTSLMLAAAAGAQTVPTKYAETKGLYSAMSPNGKYAAGPNYFLTYSGIELINLATGEIQQFCGNSEAYSYSLGTGANPISNAGIVLISTTEAGTAAYIENGEVRLLPAPADAPVCLSNAITPDGSRIAGTIGVGLTMDDVVMQRPVIWNRQADGTYSQPVELPYPKTDLTGRVPQYFLVAGISADGKTLACQMIDNYGGMAIPYILKEDADGKWSYQMLAEQYINPNKVTFGKYPGDAPNAADYLSEENKAAFLEAMAVAESITEPDPLAYMTEEQQIAYLEALSGGYANPPLFMDEDKAAEYEAAMNEYWEKQYPSAADYATEEEWATFTAARDKWEAAFSSFMNKYYAVLEASVAFDMNIFAVSQNGRYYVAGCLEGDFYDKKQHAYVFDTETGESVKKELEGHKIAMPTFVSDKGGILAGSNETYEAYISTDFNAPLTTLQDHVREKNPELYKWMEENMKTIVEDGYWDDDLEEDVIVQKEVWMCGMPAANADMSLLTTYVADFAHSRIHSYVLPLSAGIDGITTATNDTALRTTFYDLSGRRINAPANGLYIQKSVDREGRTIIKKIRK